MDKTITLSGIPADIKVEKEYTNDSTIVYGDSEHIAETLNNLISNAVDTVQKRTTPIL